ncbi:hypothetical protein K7432_017565, partial [Basidiobolus ranarum]
MTTSPNDQTNQESPVAQKKLKKPKRKPRTKKTNKRVEGPKTKVIIRRLPPNLPEELFFKSIQPYITEENILWRLYVPGKISANKNKESHFSRSYLHFKTIEDIILFHRGYDGHLFVDSKGNESRAVVEFAPFQKTPKENHKPDPREGTIEEDPDYLAFLESLNDDKKENKDSNGVSDGTTQLEKLEARLSKESIIPVNTTPISKSTPLLDYLRAQKAASKSKKKNMAGKQAPMMILTNRKKGSAGGNGNSASANGNNGSTGAKPETKPKKPSKKERERRRKERAKEKEETGEVTGKPSKDERPPKPPKPFKPKKERDPNVEGGGNKEKPPKKKGNKSNRPPKDATKGQKTKEFENAPP